MLRQVLGVLDLIGNTSLIEIDGVYAKLEYFNPSGSIKDRIAKNIIGKAEESGILKNGMKIIELTTGNTGVSFSMISSIKGYEFVAVMPRNVSVERVKIIKGFGGEVILARDMDEARRIYNRLRKTEDAFFPMQFENPENPRSYYKLADEIVNQIDVEPKYFVAGIGTGGTLIGVGKRLREYFPKIKLIGILPKEKNHGIEGIGDGFEPEIIKRNKNLIDKIVRVKTSMAIENMKYLWRRGIFAGISSGANFYVARKFKDSVTVFPDNGFRYLSKI